VTAREISETKETSRHVLFQLRIVGSHILARYVRGYIWGCGGWVLSPFKLLLPDTCERTTTSSALCLRHTDAKLTELTH
jgi:hypothetical protein